MMITEGEKLHCTQEALKKLRCEGPRALAAYERVWHSGGQVSGWGGAGGRTNRVSRPTQERALAAIEAQNEQARRLEWYACLRAALETLDCREDKSLARLRHDRLVAYALRLYVLERANGETLCLMLSSTRRVSAEHVRRLLREGVLAVKAEAEKTTLFERHDAVNGA